jgi:excisionase family DNA binding protein
MGRNTGESKKRIEDHAFYVSTPMHTIENNRLLKLVEVMELTRYSDQAIRHMAKKGEIPGAFKLGSRWRFNEKELLQWIEAREVGQMILVWVSQRPTTPPSKLMRACRRLQKALQEIAEATGQSYDEVLTGLTPDILQLLKQRP